METCALANILEPLLNPIEDSITGSRSVAHKGNSKPCLVARVGDLGLDGIDIGLQLVVAQGSEIRVGYESIETEIDARYEFLVFLQPLRIYETVGVERGCEA